MLIKTKKNSKKLFLLLPLILFLAVYNIVPQKITVSEGQKFTLLGISAKADNYDKMLIATAADANTECMVIPSGEAIGVKLYTDGVLVIGVGSVTDFSGKTKEPAKRAGIERGDRIMAVNSTPVLDSAELKQLINSNAPNVVLSVMRGETALEIPIEAVYSKEAGAYLVGLWVRDSAAGIGTLTFYNPHNSTFAALGHGICDYDTDALFRVREGSINYCRVKSVKKSEDGNPGEILGEFSEKKKGDITVNSELGIYGKTNAIPDAPLVPVAARFEVQTGKAQLLCDIDGDGPKVYEIEITRVSKSAKISGKSFVFRVCDARLLEKTGGIVQGMSGSPVLQNGKLIGAVTHVFVNDASRGYGIFAENMLDMTNMLK